MCGIVTYKLKETKAQCNTNIKFRSQNIELASQLQIRKDKPAMSKMEIFDFFLIFWNFVSPGREMGCSLLTIILTKNYKKEIHKYSYWHFKNR